MNVHDFLVLHLAGPLVSFGSIKVDEHNPTARFPGTSMLVGLLGNALGWDHGDAERLQGLQDRLRFGARCDREGAKMVDFHTVDLGQDFMRQAWTTLGRPAARAGGSARFGTHIRYRHFWADSAIVVTLTLIPPDEEPTLVALERALRHPERPLFVGRKTCLPSGPILAGRLSAPSVRAALALAPLYPNADAVDGYAACWPSDEGPVAESHQGSLLPVVDERDWANQVHVGRRLVWHGRISRSEMSDD